MKKTILLFTLLSIQYFNAQTIETVAGNGTWGFSGDYGDAINAELTAPQDVEIDDYGNIYFPTWYYRIRKVDTNGIITTIAGTGTNGDNGDGSYAVNAQLGLVKNIHIHNNEIFIADTSNHKVRKINVNGIISTIAGDGTSTYQDGVSALNSGIFPIDIAFDNNGNLIIAEIQYIRKVDSNGIISTIAGNGTSTNSGDGGLAINAGFHNINHIHIDINNNIYISDDQDSIIRKIDTDGIISTIAGIGTGGYAGDNGPATSAQLNSPKNLTSIGSELYICDSVNNRIRKIDEDGIITTFIDGNSGIFDGEMMNMKGLFFRDSYFYITATNKVAKLSNNLLSNTSYQMDYIKIYPNPATNYFKVTINNENATIKIINTLGQIIAYKKITPNDNLINIDNLNNGIYLVKIKTEKGEIIRKLIKN